jgi:hypothetical protein
MDNMVRFAPVAIMILKQQLKLHHPHGGKEDKYTAYRQELEFPPIRVIPVFMLVMPNDSSSHAAKKPEIPTPYLINESLE